MVVGEAISNSSRRRRRPYVKRIPSCIKLEELLISLIHAAVIKAVVGLSTMC